MFSYSNIKDYQVALSSGSITCQEAVEYYLSRIEANAHLNAFVEVYAGEAIARAAALDLARNSGGEMKKMHGVVVAIKDVICYKKHTVTASSGMLQGFKSLYTATALQYLIDEEAIIIGNCNCDEFAMGSSNENSVYGAVKNFIDTQRVAGGSSGGSAVAVQANLCMISLGSDTGGSVRQPADYCGIIGLKPGYGTLSRFGLLAYASSFDQIGIFAKNIFDIQLALHVMARPDKYDSTMNATSCFPLPLTNEESKKLKRFCYFKEVMDHPMLDSEIREKLHQKFDQLKGLGHTVEAIDFDLLDYVVPAYYVLTTAEASSNLSRYDGVRYGHQSALKPASPDDFYKQNRSEGFGAEVKRRIMLGTFVLSAGYYDAYYSKAQQVRQLLVQKTQEVFSRFDAILMPVAPATAPLLGESEKDPIATYLADIFTVFANLAGLPAISLPLFSHSNNMPFGLQVIGSAQNEVSLLAISEGILSLPVPSVVVA